MSALGGRTPDPHGADSDVLFYWFERMTRLRSRFALNCATRA